MHLVFVDDSKQKKPSRPDMGSIVAAGAVMVPGDSAPELERSLHSTCKSYGFNTTDEFKWSPGKELWMRTNLVDDRRRDFFLEIVEHLKAADVLALYAAEDRNRAQANWRLSPEQDVTMLLVERIAKRLAGLQTTGAVIADRPGGEGRDEDEFVRDCLELVQKGTGYVWPKEIAFILTTDSKYARLMQAADLVTSCITAYVCGEDNYSPVIAEAIKPLFPRAYGQHAGGYSVKLHPDFNFVNLYHWLFDDTGYRRGMIERPLPRNGAPYVNGPLDPEWQRTT